MAINNINSGNKALEFIDSRIKNEKYRGSPSSEHNRYVMTQIIDILILLGACYLVIGIFIINTKQEHNLRFYHIIHCHWPAIALPA